jgi:hypothetical protein
VQLVEVQADSGVFHLFYVTPPSYQELEQASLGWKNSLIDSTTFVVCSIIVCRMQHDFMFHLKALWTNLGVVDLTGEGREMLQEWQGLPCLLQPPNSTVVISAIMALGGQALYLCHLITP